MAQCLYVVSCEPVSSTLERSAEYRRGDINHRGLGTYTARRRQKWQAADILTVPLQDESLVLGQVLRYTPEALNSALCAFFRDRLPAGTEQVPIGALSVDSVICVCHVTRESLDRHFWKIISSSKDLAEAVLEAFDFLLPRDLVGTRILGSGILEKFLNAYHGLYPWDSMFEPDYFDKLLVSPSLKPPHAVLSKAVQK